MNHPVNEFVASLVGGETILRGTVIQTDHGVIAVRVGERTIRAAGDVKIGTPVSLCIRPEHVSLTTSSPGPSDAVNSYPGRVEKVTLIGLYHKVWIDCGFPLIIFVTHNSLSSPLLMKGSTVQASFNVSDVHVIRY